MIIHTIHRDLYRTRSKIIDENDSISDWFDRVVKWQSRLENSLFLTDDGRIYMAKWKKIDLTTFHHDEVTRMTSVIHRCVKFRWKYVPVE